MRFRTRAVNALLIIVCIACSGTSRKLPAGAGGILSVSPGADVEKDKGSEMELKVLFSSPRGAVSGQPEVSASFSLPMKELAKAEESPLLDGKEPLSINPPIDGELRWLGSRTVMFAPAKPLPQATFFKVEIPAGLRSLNGKTLEEPYAWEFDTPPPAVVDSFPYGVYRWGKLDQEIQIFFNQQVDPDVLKAHTTMTVSGEKLEEAAWAFSASRNPKYSEEKGYQAAAIVLTPKKDFPRNARVRVVIDKDLRGEEGPRPMGAPWETTFQTYGPFSVREFRCSWSGPSGLDGVIDCNPESSISVVFSNRVDLKEDDLKKLVTISPPLKNMTVNKYGALSEELSIYGDWKAGAKYKISFASALKDEFKQGLQGKRDFGIRTTDFDPRYGIKWDGEVMESSQDMKLPVSVLNEPGIHVWLLHLRDPGEIVDLVEASKKGSYGKFTETLKGWKGTKSFPLDYPKKKNVAVLGVVNMKKGVRGPSPTGLYAVRVEGSASDYDASTDFLRVTDIGINTKVSAGQVLVWTTSLGGGTPLPGATVTARSASGKVLWEGQTDKDGVASIPGKALWDDYYAASYGVEYCPYIFVTKGDDINFIEQCFADSISPWTFDNVYYSRYAGRKQLLGTIVTDRGVYRPGEKVRMKGYLRWLEGGRLIMPKGEEFQLRITDSRSEEAFLQSVTCNEFGSFSITYPVSSAAPTGYYYAELKEEDTDQVIGKSFGVEEYRAPSFKVTVTPKKKDVVRGEDVVFTVGGEYLFGGPMAASSVDWYMSCSGVWISSDDFPGYSFMDESSWWKHEGSAPYDSGAGKLDGQGAFDAAVKTEFKEQDRPYACQIESTVESPDRQRVAGRDSFTVHPAAYYPGLSVDESVLKKGGKLTAKIVALGAVDMKPAAGRKVGMELLRRTWQVVEGEGLYEDYYYDYEPVDKKVDGCSVTTAATPVSCTFTLPKGGEYVLRATAKDAKGNQAVSTFTVWASGYEGDISWWESRDVEMKMVADKKIYDVGDTARIMVQVPFPQSEALVTVERDGIVQHFTRHFDSNAPVIEIPVTQEMRPNIYVSVAAVRGRTKAPPKLGGQDPGKPAVKVGYINLRVETEAKRLKVGLKTDQAEYRPKGKVKVDLEVKDNQGKGRRSELAVFVVDEAVLMLTGFTLPDLTDLFYGTRALGVSNADCRLSIFQKREFGTEKGESGGGGGEEEGESEVRSLFETTIFFDPSVVTDDQGRASVSFSLPDNLTTFRVMAVAQTSDDSFGGGRTTFKVNKPLLLKPALPRFGRTDDTFEAGVLVHNYAAKDTEVKVRAEAEGITIAGQDEKQVFVPRGGAVEVTFPFAAKHPGKATVTFEAAATDDKAKDALRWEFPIRAPSVTETVATYGSTQDGVVEGIGDIEDVRGDVGGINLRMASTAFVGLDEAVEGLVEYPYGCSEQLTSRLIPMVALDEIIKEYKLAVDIDKKKLQETVDKLEDFQMYSGGWGYWEDAVCPQPWLSAYVVWGLHQAQTRGYEVSDNVLARGTEFLRNVLRDGYWCPYLPPWWQTLSLSTKAYIVYVLADMGEPEPTYSDWIYEHRAELPLFAKMLLADAIYLEASGDKSGQLEKIDKTKRERVEELLRDILNNVKQTPSSAHLTENLGDDFFVLMYSDTRSTAMALSALLDIDPDHVLVQKMVKWLLESRQKNGTWGTTQENAYALLALSDFWKEKESEEPDFVGKVLMGKHELFSSVFEGRDMKAETKYVGMEELLKSIPAKLVFSKEGTGTLYYAASLEYVPTDLPSEPIDRGIYVEREYYTFDDYGSAKEKGKQPKPVTAVNAGSNVVIVLTVVTTGKRNYVVLEDPVPAGLEVINTRFETTSQQDLQAIAGGSQLSGYAGNYGWWSNPFYHSEFYDDRFVTFADEVQPGIYRYTYLARATTKGTFIAPPAKAEEMYQPEVFGRAGYVTFEVN
jgi:uncharacterized protein YfaS (alpha-2-macroglobulin family)